MLIKYTLNKDKKLQKAQNGEQVYWIDIENPTTHERHQISQLFAISLPNRSDLHQIEYSNRFSQQAGMFHFCIDLITKALPAPESHVMSIMLTETMLITVRYTDIAFLSPHNLMNSDATFDEEHHGIFLYILRKVLGANADIFETIAIRADSVNEVLANAAQQKKERTNRLTRALREINYLRNLLSKAFHSISSLDLLTGFFTMSKYDLSSEFLAHIESLKIDIHTLMNHSDHVTRKIEFELQSTLGLINIEQTQIIKVFTVLAMIFMPPTLIASIYGMNFHFIPELDSKYGYPICLVAMFISSLLPYRFFKLKGWI